MLAGDGRPRSAEHCVRVVLASPVSVDLGRRSDPERLHRGGKESLWSGAERVLLPRVARHRDRGPSRTPHASRGVRNADSERIHDTARKLRATSAGRSTLQRPCKRAQGRRRITYDHPRSPQIQRDPVPRGRASSPVPLAASACCAHPPRRPRRSSPSIKPDRTGVGRGSRVARVGGPRRRAACALVARSRCCRPVSGS